MRKNSFVIFYDQSLVNDEDVKKRVLPSGVLPPYFSNTKTKSENEQILCSTQNNLRFGEIVGEEVINEIPQYQIRYIPRDAWTNKENDEDFCFTYRFGGKEYSPIRKTKVFEFEYFNKSVLLALCSVTNRLEIYPKWTKTQLISAIKRALKSMHNEIDKKTAKKKKENIKKLAQWAPATILSEIFLKAYDMLPEEKQKEIENFLIDSYRPPPCFMSRMFLPFGITP